MKRRIIGSACVALVLALGASVACAQGDQAASIVEVEFNQVLSIGAFDGDETEIFGRIADVRSAEDGSFFVLDQQTPALRWFDLAGHHRGSIAQDGAGPGELSEPRALAVSSTGGVAVVDPRNARYSMYGFGSEGLEYIGSMRAVSGSATSGKNICMMEDRIFLRFLEDGHLIHELGQEGAVRHSFQGAESLAATDDFVGPAGAMVAAQRSSGHLLCLEDQGLIVSVGRYSPRVEAFTLDGERVWQSEFGDFRPLEFVPGEAGGMIFEAHPDGSHLAESLVRWSPSTIVVQHSVTWPRNSRVADRATDFFQLRSIELSLRDGREVARSEGLPLLLDVRKDKAYSATNLPYPRVRVLTMRP